MRESSRWRAVKLGSGWEAVVAAAWAMIPALSNATAITLLAVGLGCIYWGGSPWLRHELYPRIPVPRWLPCRVKERWYWHLYQPIVTVNDDIKTHQGDNPKTGNTRFGIFLCIDVETINPYGETTLNFDGSRLCIEQKENVFNFLPETESLEMRVRMPENHSKYIDYVFEHGKNVPTSFKIDNEFKWRLCDVKATLLLQSGLRVSGILPQSKGRKSGLRT